MKILILSTHSDPVTVEYRIPLRTAILMAKRGHQVTVCYPRPPSRPEPVKIENLRVLFTPDLFPMCIRRGGFSPIDAFVKTVAVLKTRYDVVHTIQSHRPASFLPAFFAKYLRGSVIVDEWWEWFGGKGIAGSRHGVISRCLGVYDSVFEIRDRAIFDGVIAITRTLKNRLPAGRDVIVLHGPAECDKFTVYDIQTARRHTLLPNDLFIIGMSNTSTANHADNLPFFKAVIDFSKRHKNLRLIATGNPKYAKNILRPMFPNGLLMHFGWVDLKKYNQLLSSCNLFCLPFPNTPKNLGRWPNKIGDYFSLGRPIITNPAGDVGALFRKHRLGYLCENTPEEYQKVFERIFQNKQELTEPCADSQAVARNLLAYPKRVDLILEYYESLRARKK